ncbi:hypothetical protein Q4I28_005029 [Leishmania naiffi]|uniref:Uncharacterized protein n=1 Tax=Leishmania naiffi TaxID=5678 RepID=A0AAW3BL92_9TRYP
MLYDSPTLTDAAAGGCGLLACDYRVGCEAVGLGPDLLRGHLGPLRRSEAGVAAATDSLSLPMALSRGPTAVADDMLRRIGAPMLTLPTRRVRLSLPLGLGHCGLEHKDRADRLSKSVISEAPAPAV